MSFTWSKETTKNLIVLVEGLPELWNVLSSDYKNRVKKQAALESLAEEFKTTSVEISRKIHNLRTQLNNEIRKIRKKKSGQGSDENYTSTWEYFEALKFMLPSKKINNTVGSMDFTLSSNSEEVQITEDSEKSQPPKKKRKKDDDEILEQALKVMNEPEDDASIFGKYVASALRNLKREELKKKMRRQIQLIILDIEEQEELQENIPSSIMSIYVHNPDDNERENSFNSM